MYMPPWPTPHCPVCHQPYHLCGCTPRTRLLVPQELWSDASTSSERFVGGLADVKLTLEYMAVSGAAAPTVKVTIVDAGSSTAWEDAAVAEGFHVKNDFSTLAPGARLTLEVTETVARLRWCEVVEC
jgi:hypothetical protein